MTKAYKLKILTAYDACKDGSERASLLRREGLYHSHVGAWRKRFGLTNDESKGELKSRRTEHMLREIEQLKKKLSQAEAILTSKKSLRIAWDAHPPTREQRGELMNLIIQVGQEKSIAIDLLCSKLNISRATYYRHLDDNTCKEPQPLSSKKPVNALNCEEKKEILDLLHSERFIDKTPYDVTTSS